MMQYPFRYRARKWVWVFQLYVWGLATVTSAIIFADGAIGASGDTTCVLGRFHACAVCWASVGSWDGRDMLLLVSGAGSRAQGTCCACCFSYVLADACPPSTLLHCLPPHTPHSALTTLVSGRCPYSSTGRCASRCCCTCTVGALPTTRSRTPATRRPSVSLGLWLCSSCCGRRRCVLRALWRRSCGDARHLRSH